MRTKLLKSFIVVFTFWWLLTALLWSLAQPATNLLSLQKVTNVLNKIDFPVKPIPEHINVLQALPIQMQVIHLWSIPMAVLTVISTLLGAGIIGYVTYRFHRERTVRVAHSEVYRGISTTMGVLPQPPVLPYQQIALKSAKNEALKVLSDAELALLQAVLGTIAANPEAFAGDNRPAGSLMEGTLSLVTRALAGRHHPGLAAIVAAAGELGKITAWKQEPDGAWTRFKNEQRESGRILATLPEWWDMPVTDRLAVLFAVKYRGRPGDVPEIPKNADVHRLARNLLETEEAPPVASVDEITQQAYEQRDPETELMEVFERELSMLPFQSPGLPKNIPAAGWKRNGRAYLLENRLIENLLPKLPLNVQATYAASARDRNVRIPMMTAALLKGFHDKGWLVTSHGDDKVAPHEAMWIINAGKLEFSRVIILELPAELQAQLPSKDSFYEVTVKRPQFKAAPSQSDVSKEDLMGGMLKSKPAPAAKPAESSSAPAAVPPVAVKPTTPSDGSATREDLMGGMLTPKKATKAVEPPVPAATPATAPTAVPSPAPAASSDASSDPLFGMTPTSTSAPAPAMNPAPAAQAPSASAPATRPTPVPVSTPQASAPARRDSVMDSLFKPKAQAPKPASPQGASAAAPRAPAAAPSSTPEDDLFGMLKPKSGNNKPPGPVLNRAEKVNPPRDRS